MKLELIKKTAIAAALSVVAVAASAMTPMQDESLSQVSGQDGVSIAADLNLKIGSFVYTNTTENASVSFNNIQAKGVIAAAIDVINQTTFATEFVVPNGITAPTSFYGGGDVVRISLPASIGIDATKLLSVSVDSVTMGGSLAGTSFGKFAMNGIDIRGTNVYMWAH
ncbi:MAG TPA: DUF6160 family protein [Noviherbaspirillum sp.]|uniref:DUF6160 family protein n=1 Tax=Noviherbaspirillum sp. TaxID=1926288 RepID=UPI002B4A12EF|nr:DUF6160 family protein [Noviherbaspirillum sp.]HJV86196.1 DUF6160 family protein [Noviherbaspirillum sp.]